MSNWNYRRALLLTWFLYGTTKVAFFDSSELRQLAKDMGAKLRESYAFGVSEDKIGWARTNLVSRQVLFEKKFIHRLTKKQVICISAHEFTHLKDKHRLTYVFVSGAATISGLSLILPALDLMPLLSFGIPIVLAMHIYWLHKRFWSSEYFADEGAAKQIGNVYTDTLAEICNIFEMNLDKRSFTHPPIRRRLERLGTKP